MTVRTRFAPSPTGPLHLGHAYSAILSYDMAKAANGEFILRIENTDSSRCRFEWETQIYKDLSWLGLKWETPVMRQSERIETYQKALGSLINRGLLFPCSCSRADIKDAASAPHEDMQKFGPDGQIYPGTCKSKSIAALQHGDALRLNMEKALTQIKEPLTYTEAKNGIVIKKRIMDKSLLKAVGDIVLQRRQSCDIAYHLAVVIDDAAQGITNVVRGEDLEEATQIHVLLQKLLDLETPIYCHHKLIRDANGKRLAKRTDSKAIRLLREKGVKPNDIRSTLGLCK